MLFAPCRAALQAGFVGLVLLTIGCGKTAPPAIDIAVYPTKGKLLVGGQPSAGIMIAMTPVERVRDRQRLGQPIVRAMTEADGSFSCGTALIREGGLPVQQATGAPAGEYVLYCAPQDEEHPLRPAFEGQYRKYASVSSSTLRATVKEVPAGEVNVIPDIDLR